MPVSSAGQAIPNFSPDSRTLALGHAGWRIRFLDTQTWSVSDGPKVEMDQEEEFQLIAYTPDARRLVFITGGVFLARVQTFLDGLPNLCLEKPPDFAGLRALIQRRMRGDLEGVRVSRAAARD